MRPNSKIPCSVGIITLNSGKTIKKTLESIKDFAEIIICDGNSTDNTLNIAKQFGCKIIPQYESAEKNIPIKDISEVRNKTINAATYDWYFYIDSDDEVSPDLVDHVKQITTSNKPDHLIWKADCRILVGNWVINHSSSYPDRRPVLIHKITRAHWHKPIHETIVYNKSKYSVGVLNGNMYLCWDRQRLGFGYWDHASRWLECDYNFSKTKNANIYWRDQFLFNLFSAGGFAFRSFKQYLRFGFKDSMPIQVEWYRIWYQLILLWKLSKYYFFN